MARRLLALLAALALCACTPAWVRGETAWAGSVQWYETSDPARECAAMTGEQGKPNTAGCYRRVDGKCVVLTRRVKTESDFRALGHEVAHCAWGVFHDANGRWLQER